MIKTLFTLLLFVCISISGQKMVSNILNSTNITEIESFLKEAHPSDTRQILLKSKLAVLKNVQLKTNEEKSNIDLKVLVNPTKNFAETTQAEVKKEDNSDKKVEVVPVNPTNYYTKTIPMNNINPTVEILEKRQPIGNNLSNNLPLKIQFANNQPAPNTTKSEVATVIVPNYYNANGVEEEEFKKLFSETTKSHKIKQ